MDNSFFVEEAYNQEPGVVQHILTAHHEVDRQSGPDSHTWYLTFTQEWPVPDQANQLSFTLPYVFMREQGIWTDGWGDLMLNYRRQVWLNRERWTALAPRVSLILPTGDADRGLGDDTLGAEFNLPFSTIVGDALAFHANAGLTALPDAASANDRDLIHYQLAASAIWAVRNDLHLLIEWVGRWEHTPDALGQLHHRWRSILSPGVRYALNLPRDVQVVFGLAAPVGLNGAAADYGLFLYLSVEHSMWRPN
ncbi:transporter [Limisphaera ngatamarikiensis]|uniref:Transporter n=1 Tax=Limisphaera ngatamarikiensis TaxID=1324935 RepID=A0A6M1REW0_9BACT|nr:transporter [Limisphaera ngatamarikiensis]NGO38136.1 transporter [Limisphaera ngatamarikiensis]